MLFTDKLKNINGWLILPTSKMITSRKSVVLLLMHQHMEKKTLIKGKAPLLLKVDVYCAYPEGLIQVSLMNSGRLIMSRGQ